MTPTRTHGNIKGSPGPAAVGQRRLGIATWPARLNLVGSVNGPVRRLPVGERMHVFPHDIAVYIDFEEPSPLGFVDEGVAVRKPLHVAERERAEAIGLWHPRLV